MKKFVCRVCRHGARTVAFDVVLAIEAHLLQKHEALRGNRHQIACAATVRVCNISGADMSTAVVAYAPGDKSSLSAATAAPRGRQRQLLTARGRAQQPKSNSKIASAKS